MEDSFELLVQEYHSMKRENADIDEILEKLQEISNVSYQEDLMFEWILWYWKADYPARAKRVCKQMIHFFHDGEWVDRAKAALMRLNDDEDFPDEYEAYLKASEMSGKKEQKREPEIPSIIEDAFQSLVGMDAVKKELVSFYNLARLEKLREQQLGVSADSGRGYNFVLYGNPGTGKTTVARIIAKVLYSLGIRKNDHFVEVDRSKLVGEHIGETAQLVSNAIQKARGGTLFIDEAYELYVKDSSSDFGREAIDTLLKDMEDHRSEYTVIIAGYRSQMTNMLNLANPGFRSRFNYHIDIPDYSDDELVAIARKMAGARSYSIEDGGCEALRKRISRERIDETFGNARFVREVLEKAELNLASRLASMKNFSQRDLTVLTAADINPEQTENNSLEKLMDQLEGLIGLSQVKMCVQELVDQILVQKEAERRGIRGDFGTGTLHMSFKGNPGTGKTTVARLVGKIFAEMGVLKRDDVFIEVSRAHLVGQYQGHTAVKVQEAVRSALGGVLFIDEAYSLVSGPGDTFGREAVDTLVAEMENHRDSLMVILAGSSSDIDCFLEENQGLRSRVPRDLFFADYTLDEMVQIFLLQAQKDGFSVEENAIDDLYQLLAEKSRTRDFGNGRGVRNVYEAVKRAQSSRMAKLLRSGNAFSDEAMIRIICDDIKSV